MGFMRHHLEYSYTNHRNTKREERKKGAKSLLKDIMAETSKLRRDIYPRT